MSFFFRPSKNWIIFFWINCVITQLIYNNSSFRQLKFGNIQSDSNNCRYQTDERKEQANERKWKKCDEKIEWNRHWRTCQINLFNETETGEMAENLIYQNIADIKQSIEQLKWFQFRVDKKRQPFASSVW